MNQFIAQPPRGGVTLGPHGVVDRAGVVHHIVMLRIDDVCDDHSTNTIRFLCRSFAAAEAALPCRPEELRYALDTKSKADRNDIIQSYVTCMACLVISKEGSNGGR